MTVQRGIERENQHEFNFVATYMGTWPKKCNEIISMVGAMRDGQKIRDGTKTNRSGTGPRPIDPGRNGTPQDGRDVSKANK